MSTQRLSDQLMFARDDDSLLSLHLVSRGPVVIIEVSGEVDLSTAHLLTELAEYALRDEPLRLVLDLAKVTFFCADGVGALVRIQRAVCVQAGQLILVDPSPITLRVLTVTRVIDRFEIHAAASAA